MNALPGKFPAFLWVLTPILSILSLGSVQAQYDSTFVRQVLEARHQSLGLSASDIREFSIRDQHTSQPGGITHIYVQQQHWGIDVHNALISIHLRSGEIIKVNNRFHPQVVQGAPSHFPSIGGIQSVQAAAEHLGKKPGALTPKLAVSNRQGQLISQTFNPAGLSREDIGVDLLWLPSEDKRLKLVWQVAVHEIDQDNYWHIFVDAHQGTVVKKENHIIHCHFAPPEHDHHLYRRTESIPEALMSDSSYRVFPMPVESPAHGDRVLVMSPWDLAGQDNQATTLGWHNDGSTSYTITRGNNVYAYEDRDGNNVPGFSPASPTLAFDFTFDPLASVTDNESAAITNLFFWNNLIHDVMYQYGFDEAAGNFQASNLGRGGLGNDWVRAEAQDGGGTNNANFFTPPDGQLPRMQMYLWSPAPLGSPLTINQPASLDSVHFFAEESAFSVNNKIVDVGPVTADLVLVQDQNNGTHLACSANPVSNGASLTGKIALIDRGECFFIEKVKNVQNLGAVAALIVNNVSGDPVPMGDTDNSIVIPAFMIRLADGAVLKEALLNGPVNITLAAVPEFTPDGDFDNGIITHEYGHGISNRLTGGPSNVSCLTNAEQMGEGWSDYFGLMLTTDWTDALPEDPRGIGTYVLGSAIDGTGIRTYPYSTSLEINPFTYDDIKFSSSVHYIGSVWATMLWEMTWKIMEMEGPDPDIYHGSGGNNIALRLVMEGLKLQPCNPGFVDGRDAILLADELLYDGSHRCAIWEAFAKRGLGRSAQQNDPDDHIDGIEAFDVPSGVSIVQKHTPDIASEGTRTTFNILAICECDQESGLVFREVIPAGLTHIESDAGVLVDDSLFFAIPVLSAGDTSKFSFSGVIQPCVSGQTMVLRTDNAEGPDQFTSVKLAGTGDWVKSGTTFHSASTAWYAQDYNSTADFALTLNTPIATEGIIRIHFHHRYQTEDTYDGGVVECSIDGGTTWKDAGPYFTQNGYPTNITTVNTDSRIAGRPAFTGFSDTQFGTSDFIESAIELCLPEAASLHLRFRFVCDGGVAGSGLNGWFVDDITIEHLSGIVLTGYLTASDSIIDSLIDCVEVMPFEGSKIYVDQSATGSGGGHDWPNAMNELVPALAMAGCREADSVLVAAGIYLPGLNSDPTSSFLIPDSTFLFGGFPLGGGTFGERDPEMHLSTMSGDIGTLNHSTDNTYYVLRVLPGQKGIVLDGMTIRDANPETDVPGVPGAPVLSDGELTLIRTSVSNPE
jgi:extracellular elastinolytic metalloproteinase